MSTFRKVVLVIALLAVGAMLGAAGLLFGAERLQEFIADDRMTPDVHKVPPTDVAMVLGTAPYLGVPSNANPDFLSRLDTAAALWRAGRVKYLLVSGNSKDPVDWDETTPMRDGLVARGVPAAAIYRDNFGIRTWDSIARARDVFGLKRLVVVSQRSHVARALFLARSLGIEAFGLEAEQRNFHGFYGALRHYPAALVAYLDAWRGKLPRLRGTAVVIGVDPAN